MSPIIIYDLFLLSLPCHIYSKFLPSETGSSTVPQWLQEDFASLLESIQSSFSLGKGRPSLPPQEEQRLGNLPCVTVASV